MLERVQHDALDIFPGGIDDLLKLFLVMELEIPRARPVVGDALTSRRGAATEADRLGVEPGKEQQAEAAIIAELEGLKNGPITQEEVDDCRRGLLSSMDALGDSLAALENWYYGQITRGEPLYPPEYGKVLTSAVSLDEVRQTLQSYSYSVCYAVTAEPGTQGKGGSEDVE